MRSIPWLKVCRILLVLSLPAAVIYHFFDKVFACPSCYLFEDIGDGLKNYYTLAWYVVHDQGWHFSGMNYPYGEQIIYTDNQPVLAMALRWVHHHILPLNRHIIGILNMLLILSLYIGVMCTYKLLRRWEVGRWWALGGAMCIIFLSPQLMRFHGHYGLAYVCFFPLLFLLLDFLVRGNGKKWLWGICIGALIIIMSLTHMYFLLMGLLAVFSFLLFWAWYHRKEKQLLRQVSLTLILALVLPTLLLLGIRKYTDPIRDRPTEPWGIDQHAIDFTTTFYSFIPPFDKAWTDFWKIEKPNLELVAYTGMIGLLLLPVAFIFLIKRKEEEIDTQIKAFLGASLLCWLMASGTLYHHGFQFLWKAVPVLKQFRGLGRFGIPFYYLYTISCTYLLWILFQKMKYAGLEKAGTYLLGVVFFVWGFEAWMNMEDTRKPIYHTNAALNDRKEAYTPILQSAGHAPEDFQAILQFPLVAIGNENFGVARGFWTLREGIRASWELELPLIDYSMSRTSISQGTDILALISSPYALKKRTALMNDQPLLLLCEEEFVTPAERQWINKAQKLGTFQSITLYSISPKEFNTLHLPAFEANQNIPCNGWFLDFESNPCDTAMQGKGAMPVPSAPFSVWSFTDTTRVERSWIVSFWTYVDNYHSHVAVPRMMETDPNGTVTQNSGLHREHIDWAEAYENWAETRFPLTTKGKGYKYELFMDTQGPVIDNLLIRPSNDTCVYHLPGMTLYNNIPVPK